MFKLVSDFKPSGDQPEAINNLVQGINDGMRGQTLLGVTGSGKTFTMANIIERVQRPTLVLAHNKTLAGQLYAEFKELFPENAVEYFISYYDYYQPEAYIAATDTYIEKDSSINDEIDRMRHEATKSLLTRDDVIIVASVSCIYGIGEKEDYLSLALMLETGLEIPMDNVMAQLLSDNSQISIRFGLFKGKTKASSMYAVREFGNDCLLYSLDGILRYGEVLNVPQADERNRVVERKEVPLFNQNAYREAVINAFVHNHWLDGPSVYCLSG